MEVRREEAAGCIINGQTQYPSIGIACFPEQATGDGKPVPRWMEVAWHVV